MANTFLGLDTPNIAAGWGPAPQLHAAPISGVLVRDICRQRRYQEDDAEKHC